MTNEKTGGPEEKSLENKIEDKREKYSNIFKLQKVNYKVNIKQDSTRPEYIKVYFKSERQYLYKEVWIVFYDENNNEISRQKLLDGIDEHDHEIDVMLDNEEVEKFSAAKTVKSEIIFIEE